MNIDEARDFLARLEQEWRSSQSQRIWDEIESGDFPIIEIPFGKRGIRLSREEPYAVDEIESIPPGTYKLITGTIENPLAIANLKLGLWEIRE